MDARLGDGRSEESGAGHCGNVAGDREENEGQSIQDWPGERDIGKEENDANAQDEGEEYGEQDGDKGAYEFFEKEKGTADGEGGHQPKGACLFLAAEDVSRHQQDEQAYDHLDGTAEVHLWEEACFGKLRRRAADQPLLGFEGNFGGTAEKGGQPANEEGEFIGRLVDIVAPAPELSPVLTVGDESIVGVDNLLQARCRRCYGRPVLLYRRAIVSDAVVETQPEDTSAQTCKNQESEADHVVEKFAADDS